MKAADNEFLGRSMDVHRRSRVSRSICGCAARPGAGDPEGQRASVNGEHLEILRLIERRLADDAREYMRYHIQSAYEYMIKRIPVGDKA